MRIVVVGGSGLVGARLVSILRGASHEAVVTSLKSGVNPLTGEKLVETLAGAEVLVDLANPPSFAARAVLDFFVASSRNLLAAEAVAGVQHHVVLSTVGIDRVEDGDYFRAKAAQEDVIRRSSTPYTIVRSTQPVEFLDRILRLGADSDAIVRLPVTLVQPIVVDDLAEALAAIATAPPRNATVEVAGPETIYLHELARLILSGREDPRRVVASEHARYFGALLSHQSLIPGPDAQIGSTMLRDWLRQCIMAG
jgi:uncharacterized protein YbjT (DUF2867 family)